MKLEKEKIWKVREADENKVNNLVEELSLNRVLAQVLVNRGLEAPHEVEEFLQFDIKDLNDPFLFAHMERAVERIARAIKEEERIIIYGDYDVDGITSTSLLVDYLRSLGARVDYYIPNRLKEGYGLNLAAIEKLSNEGELIITVDCGIKAIEEIEYANQLGLEVIVTDHHTVPEVLPPAYAIINPKLPQSNYPWQELAGVGVAFKLAQALALRIEGKENWPVLIDYLDLVAFGTVADIVPLVKENRIMTSYGLEFISQTDNYGLEALVKVVGLEDKEISSGQIGYILAPRINAAGRIGNPDLGVELFLAQDKDTAAQLAHQLDSLNKRRQEISKEMFDQAKEAISQLDLDKDWVIVLASPNWHPGVAGNVASDINEVYHRPVILISLDDNDNWQGSARSIKGLNLYDALAANEDLLIRFGGHSQAAGLSIAYEDIDQLRMRLNQYAHQVLTEEDLISQLKIDYKVDFEEISYGLVEGLDRLAPFGCRNPRPVLVSEGLKAKRFKVVGASQDHLKLTLSKDGEKLGAIAFGKADLNYDLMANNEDLKVAYNLELNTWQGNTSLQANVKDMKFSKVDLIEKIFAKQELIRDRENNLNDYYYTTIKIKDKSLVSQLDIGERVLLLNDSSNLEGKVKLIINGQREIGYLEGELGEKLASYLDVGVDYKGLISEIEMINSEEFLIKVFITKSKDKKRQEEQCELQFKREEWLAKDDKEAIEEIKNILINDFNLGRVDDIINILQAGQSSLISLHNNRLIQIIWANYFALQFLKEEKMGMIIHPTIDSVKDSYNLLIDRLAVEGVRVYQGRGELTSLEQEELKRAFVYDEVDILLLTTQFLRDNLDWIMEFKEKIEVSLVDWTPYLDLNSKSFVVDYKLILQLLKELENSVFTFLINPSNEELNERLANGLAVKNKTIDSCKFNNLQIVDKRNYSNKLSYLNSLTKFNGTIVCVNNLKSSIRLATTLRKDNARDEIAFINRYLNVNEVVQIKKRFIAGNIELLVVPYSFFINLDITGFKKLILYHLPLNYHQFKEVLLRANDNNTQVHLLYGENDIEFTQALLTNRIPKRGVLASLYRALYQLQNEEGWIDEPIERLIDQVNDKLKDRIEGKTIKAGVDILEELNLLSRFKELTARIKLASKPNNKLDLEVSMLYNEGVKDRELFNQLKECAFSDIKNYIQY